MGAVFSVAGFIGSVLTSVPFMLVILLVAAPTIPWVTNQDTVMEEAEHAMRSYAFPAYRDTVRPIMENIRFLYNPISCFFGATNWVAYGLVVDAIYPTATQCGISPLFTAVGHFVDALLTDFLVNYFLQQQFFNGPCDWTNVTATGIHMVNEWITLYSCMCYDCSELMQSLPIIPSPLFSAQWADPQTWCALTSIADAAMELFNQLLRLLLQLLYAILNLVDPQSAFASATFIRPNFYVFFSYLCTGGSCLMRSLENAIQRFWDNFVPFKFVWSEYLSILDSAFCIILKTINWALTFVINIDKVINFPTDPFWESGMRPLIVESLNLVGAPSQFASINAPIAPFPTRFTMYNWYLGEFVTHRTRARALTRARPGEPVDAAQPTEPRVRQAALHAGAVHFHQSHHLRPGRHQHGVLLHGRRAAAAEPGLLLSDRFAGAARARRGQRRHGAHVPLHQCRGLFPLCGPAALHHPDGRRPGAAGALHCQHLHAHPVRGRRHAEFAGGRCHVAGVHD